MNNLSELMAEAEQLRHRVNASFSSLSTEQINWKPSEGQWSIAQCLEHLILLNEPYFPKIERILAGEYSPSLWERMPLLPTYFGRVVLAAVEPGGKQRFKARPSFVPRSSPIDTGIVARFSAHQADLIRLMEASAKLPIDKIIITSVVSPFVTYSLWDAYRILVAHEQRHLQHAEGVMRAQGPLS
jgi:DinB family protein